MAGPGLPPAGRSAIPFPFEDNPTNNRTIGQNLRQVVRDAVAAGQQRPNISDALIRTGHRLSLQGIPLADRHVVGNYRGSNLSNRLRTSQVRLPSGHKGAKPERVAEAVRRFVRELQRRVTVLDGVIPSGAPPVVGSTEELAVIELCAWVHGEWVRIHPFVNCNGSTARLWVTYVAARYGVALVMPGKPRPPAIHGTPVHPLDYLSAAAQQMDGTDLPMTLWLEGELRATQQRQGLTTLQSP